MDSVPSPYRCVCGEPHVPEARFCVACGRLLAAEASVGPTVKLDGRVCGRCAAVNPTSAQFCAECGEGLRPTASWPSPRVSAPPAQRHATLPAAAGPSALALWPLAIPFGIVLLVLLLNGHRGGFPFFFLFLPFGLMGGLGRRVRHAHGLGLLWLVGLAAAWLTGFWPLIFVLFALTWALGR